MSLELTHQRLGWPPPEEIRNPSGEGSRIFAKLAQDKIGRPISQLLDRSDLKIGVLSPNSQSDSTEAPLAIVAEFSGQATDNALRELHRLSWNFSHSPTVVTIESDLLRVWTCCEPPDKDRPLQNYVVQGFTFPDLKRVEHTDIPEEAARVLHWVNLVSGQFFSERAERFRRDQRADQLLLANLHSVRQLLRDAELNDDDVCHDLLARIIFVQFLFDRKDQNGRSALNESRLAGLQEAGILRGRHKDLPEILSDYDETYRLFDWLNSKFNGDLFPGKKNTPVEREQAWRQEKAHVKSRHLRLLREFIKGDLEMKTGQRCLWPQYSFDAIPLEFISSIYEAFVTKRARSEGIYYTPPHLVDFILDRVLPWNSEKWDLKILDPACGSGVFLVKAFQRLIHRWKRANPKEDIRAETLRGLLERNLFGVDKDPHAVRVAAFSLYLAMCDEIDPKHYWTQIHFPPMRGHRLINADFFEEHQAGFCTSGDRASYDLVIGNAPWGEEILTEAAITWASNPDHKWPVVNKGIGTLFLTKAAKLTQPKGRVAMIQSASSILFNRSGPACAFRKQFFTSFGVQEVVNLSALRFKVFNRKTHSARKSVAPSCVIIFEPRLPSDEKISYVSPKEAETLPDDFHIIIEPQDQRGIRPYDAAQHAEAWTTMMWGGPRDYVFVR
ncbi:MAG TPA: N-6 DNA methylase, partial [Pyrinomonadaceae bacterium]|nr:N-6 DNA methylase [Pyrinomonadaceae bacterium]